MTLVFAAAMAVVLIGLGLFIYLRFASDLDASLDDQLRTRNAEIGAQLRRTAEGEGAGGAARQIVVRQDEKVTQVLAPSGRVLAASAPVGERSLLDRAALARAAEEGTFSEVSAPALEGPTRLFTAPSKVGAQRVVVVVGESLEDRNDSLASLARVLLIGAPIALLLTSIVGYFVVGAALHPVEAMRRKAAAISASDAHERLPVSGSGDELARLGETLNGMLARLEAAMKRERQFVDDASHELRTPLALHKTELELALRYGRRAEELRAAIASAIEEADRIIQLAEDLLVVARDESADAESARERIDVGEVLATISQRFGSRAETAGRPLSVDAPEGLGLDGDRVRLEQALGNMVDNALRYGEGEIRLRAAPVDGRVQIHVADRGSGFPPALLEHAFERFTRGDTARTRGGTGLGLAIVAAVASSHGGSAQAENRDGADVWLDLPQAL